MSLDRIAFIGLGRMGAPMARAASDAGFHIVVYNRTRSAAVRLAGESGMTVADSPAEAARNADVVVLMLSNAEVTLDLCAGPQGILASLKAGAVVVDMGTTGIAGNTSLKEQVSNAGGILVDAPVLGSPAAAGSRSLTVMAGGPADVVQELEPLFRSMASQVYHVGDTGAGNAMKLSVNTVIFAIVEAVSEGLSLADASGVDRHLAYEIFKSGAVGCPEVRDREANFLYPESTPASFSLSLAQKDLRLIVELASATRLSMPQAELNREIVDGAVAKGMQARDMAALEAYLRSGQVRSGLSRRRAET